jgi:hypothetical protein
MVVPNKVYQAVAAGRPLVTRDGPGLREVLVPGEHCLACPPDDPVGLATAVAALLDDPARAARMGAAGRAHLARELGPARLAAALAATLAARLGPAAAAGAPALARS